MASRRTEEKKFQSSLRQRLGMPEPEAALQDAWTALEEGVGAVKDASDVLLEASKGSPEVEQAASDGVTALANGLEQVVSAVEAVETVLVEQGLIEDDDLLETDTPAPDA